MDLKEIALMLIWEHTWAFYLLALLPLLGLGYLWGHFRRRQRLHAFADPHIIPVLAPEMPLHKYGIKFLLFIISLACIILAMANPQMGSKLEEVTRKGIEVMVALDVSRSMNATDVGPSRLEKSKYFVEKLLGELQGDQVGLIVFAGNAYVQMPITSDYAAASLFLESVSTDIAPRQGTAIGESIRLALESMDMENGTNKAILVVSDGENHEGDAIEAATEAANLGVRVYCVGVGTTKGGPVPLLSNGDRYDYQRDKEGSIITSRLDPAMLAQVAEAGKGAYMGLDNTRETAQLINEELLKLEKSDMETQVFTDYEDQFQVFMAIALALLLADWLTVPRKNKWLRKLKLYE
ncbi:MAG: VWA domain-containing protein [Bacteroidetes bacterium]|jgi:Ca-activated chloride channel family protein|nr:VWA domain-containing protein [Bacteroidota bacterium]